MVGPILRAWLTILLLYGREYPEAKLQENLDAEIFGVLAEEARDAFDEGVVVELKSETAEDIDSNCERILEWVKKWREEHGSQHNMET
jgi:adenylate kinase